MLWLAGLLGLVAFGGAALAELSPEQDETASDDARDEAWTGNGSEDLLETLSVQLRDQLPSLFEPTSQEIRAALGRFASGGRFADLARGFFARLTVSKAFPGRAEVMMLLWDKIFCAAHAKSIQKRSLPPAFLGVSGRLGMALRMCSAAAARDACKAWHGSPLPAPALRWSNCISDGVGV